MARRRRRARRNPVETLAFLNPVPQGISLVNIGIAGLGALGWNYIYSQTIAKWIPQISTGIIKPIVMGLSGFITLNFAGKYIGRRYVNPAIMGIGVLAGLQVVSQLTQLPLGSLGQEEEELLSQEEEELARNVPEEVMLGRNVPEFAYYGQEPERFV